MKICSTEILNTSTIKSLTRGLVGLCLILGIVAPVAATETPPARPQALDSLYRNAQEAFYQNEWSRALAITERILHQAPAYIGYDSLPAAYWKIYLLQRLGKPIAAVTELNRALTDSLLSHNPAIQYLWIFFAVQGTEREALADSITQTYYGVLSRATPRQSGLWQMLYARQEFFLPDSVRRAVTTWKKQPDLFSTPPLLQFWKELDPTPSTIRNEAVLEYVRRVAHALETYPAPTVTGFDDRGKIYVQLGPPARKGSFQQDPTTDLQPYDYRPHEIWAYWQISPRLYFVFIDYQDGKGFRLAPSIEDALPLSLPVYKRIQFYEQLGRYAADLYYRIDLIERVYRDEPNPASARTKMLQELRRLDDTNAEITRRITPTFYVQQYERAREFDLEIRSALLAGETRRENLLVLALGLPAEPLAKLERKLDFETWEVYLNTAIKNSQRDFIERFSDMLLNIQTYRASDSLTFRKQFPVKSNPFQITGELSWYGTKRKLPGVRLLGAFTSFETGERTLLNVQRKTLEMSDVLIATQPPPNPEMPALRQWFIQHLWPYRWMYGGKPLYLYFEIYNLLPGPDGLTRYRVAYRVKDLGQKRNFLKRLISLVLPRKGTITSEGEYAGSSPTAIQWIALDLSSYRGGRMLQITVEVKDLITQKRIYKSLEVGVL